MKSSNSWRTTDPRFKMVNAKRFDSLVYSLMGILVSENGILWDSFSASTLWLTVPHEQLLFINIIGTIAMATVIYVAMNRVLKTNWHASCVFTVALQLTCFTCAAMQYYLRPESCASVSWLAFGAALAAHAFWYQLTTKKKADATDS